ncbi:MAG: sulfatase [Bacteroidetes bacterium]|nr:sulfatase [Bacteroidota bacterium]
MGLYKENMRVLAAFTFFVIFSGCQVAEPPNFVFILADDLGYMDVGAYNSDTFYKTPNIDQLAAEGIRFTQGYAAAPVCSPTRASLLTGLYPSRMATTDYFGAPQPDGVSSHWTRNKPLLPARYESQLSHSAVTVAEALLAVGYKTFWAGKWHLEGQGSYPEDHGFQVNRGGWESGGPYGRGNYFVPYDNPKLEDGPTGEHLPARLATETVKFIEANQDESFIAYLSFYSVHTPLMARADLQAKYEAEHAAPTVWGTEGERQVRHTQNHVVYAAMIEAMDEAVGTVLVALDELGLKHNTVVIFTSDNGGLSTSEGHPTSNLPLRAGKGWVYEGGIREPFIMRWPMLLDGGQIESTPIISPDLMPTLLQIAGLPEPDVTDGVSLLPLLMGQQMPERDLYWHYPHYGNQGGSPVSAVRRGDWKLIRFYEDDREELYDLAVDVSESEDMASIQTEKLNELSNALDMWLNQVDARFPTPNPAIVEKSNFHE